MNSLQTTMDSQFLRGTKLPNKPIHHEQVFVSICRFEAITKHDSFRSNALLPRLEKMKIVHIPDT